MLVQQRFYQNRCSKKDDDIFVNICKFLKAFFSKLSLKPHNDIGSWRNWCWKQEFNIGFQKQTLKGIVIFPFSFSFDGTLVIFESPLKQLLLQIFVPLSPSNIVNPTCTLAPQQPLKLSIKVRTPLSHPFLILLHLCGRWRGWPLWRL